METQVHIRIEGRVQLVMFRDFTQRKARRLGLVGTVQNLDDGSVEAHVRGPREKIEALVEKLHKGPVLARVDNVVVREEALKDYKGFSIIF